MNFESEEFYAVVFQFSPGTIRRLQNEDDWAGFFENTSNMISATTDSAVVVKFVGITCTSYKEAKSDVISVMHNVLVLLRDIYQEDWFNRLIEIEKFGFNDAM